MKLRSTTPRLLPISRWALVVVLLSVLTLLIGLNASSGADDNRARQSRINELTKEIERKVSSSRELNTQSGSIQSQIDALKKERDYLDRQLQQNTMSQSELEKNIKVTEEKLHIQREVLGNIMANMYIDDSISPLEMLASSQSVADFIDNQTMRESMQQQLSTSIAQVKQSSTQLAQKKQELARIIGDQKNQQLALQQRQSEQNTLLVATQNQSGELTQITAMMAAERKELQEQQQKTLVSQMGGAEQVTPGTISQPVVSAPKPPTPPPTPSPGSPSAPTPPPTPAPAPVVLPNGGYPSNLQNCYVDANALSYGIDPWGYGCRQCVSYTAWKVLQKTGRPAMYWGNANQWPASARRVGYQTGASPRAQSVAVMTSGPYGHVAWVESINPNGTLNISQYNYWLPGKSNGGWGWYSEFRNVSPSTYQAYIYV